MTRRAVILVAGCLSPAIAMAQPSPSSWSGVPQQIIPQSVEVGAPTFTTPTGASTFGGLNGTGSTAGGSISGPTSGATAAVGSGSTVSYTNPDGPVLVLDGPVDVVGNPPDPRSRLQIDGTSFHAVTRMQMVFDTPGTNTQALDGEPVTLRGTLFQKVSGENFTDVLVNVQSVAIGQSRAK